MSLLLEALKKAEKAKEDAQRRAKGADAAAPVQPSAFDPEMTVVDDGRHVTTRDELPAASTPLEILAEELRPAAARSAPMELRLADEPPAQEPKTAPRREPARAAASAQSNQSAQNAAAGAERATAQRVFEAKFKEPNPRLPFFITMGVLGAFAVGTGIYFWIQLRPAPPLVNPNPQRAADEKPVDPAALKPTALPSAPGSPPAAAASAIPGLPGSALQRLLRRRQRRALRHPRRRPPPLRRRRPRRRRPPPWPRSRLQHLPRLPRPRKRRPQRREVHLAPV
jgi:hypothetical protein